VTVPESATLSPPLVAAICRAADVEPLDFFRVLDARDRVPDRGARSSGSSRASAIA